MGASSPVAGRMGAYAGALGDPAPWVWVEACPARLIHRFVHTCGWGLWITLVARATTTEGSS